MCVSTLLIKSSSDPCAHYSCKMERHIRRGIRPLYLWRTCLEPISRNLTPQEHLLWRRKSWRQNRFNLSTLDSQNTGIYGSLGRPIPFFFRLASEIFCLSFFIFDGTFWKLYCADYVLTPETMWCYGVMSLWRHRDVTWHHGVTSWHHRMSRCDKMKGERPKTKSDRRKIKNERWKIKSEKQKKKSGGHPRLP